MISLVVVDVSAEARAAIVDRITSFLREHAEELHFVPRIEVKPLSPQELKFHAAPHVCVIGPKLVHHEITEIANIRKVTPASALLVFVEGDEASLSSIEQLARFGADDVVDSTVSGRELIKRIVLLSKKAQRKKSNGTLIVVDSAKGGSGVTSVAAGVAEAMVHQGKRVALVDLDFSTQDLSRFLQARPYVNEMLQLLLDGNRPVSEQFVEECLVQVWSDEPNLWCMSPCPESEAGDESRAAWARIFLSILEVLDGLFDAVVVDCGCARGALLRALYHVADRIVYVLNNDPATLYACADRLQRFRQLMSPDAELLVIDNSRSKSALSNLSLRTEFNRAAKIEAGHWHSQILSFSKSGTSWPASGGTLYSSSGASVARFFSELASRIQHLDTLNHSPTTEPHVSLILRIRERIKKLVTRASLPISESAQPIGALPSASQKKLLGTAKENQPTRPLIDFTPPQSMTPPAPLAAAGVNDDLQSGNGSLEAVLEELDPRSLVSGL